MAAKADPEVDRRVDASPEKRFFISMLVKDIELIPSIVDLVDNSVDGARALRKDGNFKNLWVRLTIGRDGFTISDNCGGIEVEVARKYAFRFGRPEEFTGIEESVGQFGVGMKRALFKLGDKFKVESVAARSTFSMEVDVPAWAAKPGSDWTFELLDVDESVRPRAGARGTTITVASLHQQVREDFADETTATRVATQIALQHQSAIAGGLRIDVNDHRLRATIPLLLSSKTIKPINHEFKIPADGGSVNARIVAGIAAPRERDNHDDGEAEEFAEPGEAGWYVFCNGRLVLAAERTELTGWGKASAAYHPQYRRFRGYAFLTARDSSLLPWNTTKTGLDQDSHVFRVLQQQMFSALAAVAAVLNRQKKEVQQRPDDDRPLTLALSRAKASPIGALATSTTYVAPTAVARPKMNKKISVQYSVLRTDMEYAMELTDLSSAGKVGELSFYYFLRHEGEEE